MYHHVLSHGEKDGDSTVAGQTSRQGQLISSFTLALLMEDTASRAAEEVLSTCSDLD